MINYALVLQVGSSVARPLRLCTDIDVVALTADNSSNYVFSKRVFQQRGELDLEFSLMPLALPALLSVDPTLHFFLFRERKKLESSVLIHGAHQQHAQFRRSLLNLPLPVQAIQSCLQGIRSQLNPSPAIFGILPAFFSVTTLLGFTHFPHGPVKPKWMWSELTKCSVPEIIEVAKTLTRVCQRPVSQTIIRKLEMDRHFVAFWESRSTAWSDACFWAKSDEAAAALSCLYCIDVYGRHPEASVNGPATQVGNWLAQRIEEESPALLRMLEGAVEAVEARL